ncbi:MAG: hypothetical protein HC919_15515 [Oscillatoriales cyanobacterium SM2_2_1]|nr:hypothetical protein [Oscillatoriales cyanobacterium SM2_2_1]
MGGKYDEDGNRRKVDIAEGAVSMQKIYQRLNTTPEAIAVFAKNGKLKS